MIFLLLPLIATLADFPNPPPQQLAQKSGTETAVLAGGCFWGMEGVFERLTGVTEVVSGYSGGDSSSARYELVGIGTTGHAESIKITFDPSRITYASLLKVFFSIAHDPTELNYQGPDVGSQYRSVIFYNSAEQKLIAEEYIRTLEASREFPLPIVTQAAALNAFYPAED